MALTVKALRDLLEQADPEALVVLARFDGDEVHTDTHIDEHGQVVIREQGRGDQLIDLAEAAARSIVADPRNPTDQGDLPLLKGHIHEAVAGGLEPVKPIRELRLGLFADDEE